MLHCIAVPSWKANASGLPDRPNKSIRHRCRTFPHPRSNRVRLLIPPQTFQFASPNRRPMNHEVHLLLVLARSDCGPPVWLETSRDRRALRGNRRRATNTLHPDLATGTLASTHLRSRKHEHTMLARTLSSGSPRLWHVRNRFCDSKSCYATACICMLDGQARMRGRNASPSISKLCLTPGALTYQRLTSLQTCPSSMRALRSSIDSQPISSPFHSYGDRGNVAI